MEVRRWREELGVGLGRRLLRTERLTISPVRDDEIRGDGAYLRGS